MLRVKAAKSEEEFEKLIFFRHVVGIIDGLNLQDDLIRLWLKRDSDLRQRITDNLI